VCPILTASTRREWKQHWQQDGSCDWKSERSSHSPGRLIRETTPFLLPILVASGSLVKPRVFALQQK